MPQRHSFTEQKAIIAIIICKSLEEVVYLHPKYFLSANVVFALMPYLCSEKSNDMKDTKNLFTRIKLLDELLSDQYHDYSMDDIVDKINDRLEDMECESVTRRCIEKDIKYLKEKSPFGVFIKTHLVPAYDKERDRACIKHCLKYEDPGFSIFQKKISKEERNLLREFLSTLGQFEGLAHFEWLDKLKSSLEINQLRQIICFSNNPYLNNLLGTLFDLISNEVVVRLSYHTFPNPDIRSIDFHPYLLKQYNERWYLLGAADSDNKILTFALDRIDDVKPLPEKKYIECPDELNDRFDDIVGVTLNEDRPIEHILLWVSDIFKGYIETKPIHGSQTPQTGEKEQNLREKYPQLKGGMFFTLDCISNHEIINVLCSFGENLIVLQSDGTIQSDIDKTISKMNEIYSSLRTSRS